MVNQGKLHFLHWLFMRYLRLSIGAKRRARHVSERTLQSSTNRVWLRFNQSVRRSQRKSSITILTIYIICHLHLSNDREPYWAVNRDAFSASTLRNRKSHVERFVSIIERFSHKRFLTVTRETCRANGSTSTRRPGLVPESTCQNEKERPKAAFDAWQNSTAVKISVPLRANPYYGTIHHVINVACRRRLLKTIILVLLLARDWREQKGHFWWLK